MFHVPRRVRHSNPEVKIAALKDIKEPSTANNLLRQRTFYAEASKV